MALYKLLAPFRVSDTEIAQPGEFLDLPDDVAALHAGKLERQADAAPSNGEDAAPAAS